MKALETWRPIPGYRSGYEVSSLGRVRSVARVVTARASNRAKGHARRYPPRVLRPGRQDRFGHASVAIGRGNSVAVHILVALAFHGPRPSKADVAHINGDGADNRACNLRWASRSENNRDVTRHGRRRLTWPEVIAIRYALAEESRRGLQRELAGQFGVSEATICAIKQRRLYARI
jgi:hypothetical protein